MLRWNYMQKGCCLAVTSLLCAPGMGDNLVVKVHYGLGSRNRQPKARVSIVRWNLKEAGLRRLKGPPQGKVSGQRTEISYKAG